MDECRGAKMNPTSIKSRLVLGRYIVESPTSYYPLHSHVTNGGLDTLYIQQ